MSAQKKGPRVLLGALADQGLSSATNLGLSLLAGRALGPDGLGVVFLGFSVYLLCLGLARSLITEPLITTSTSSEELHWQNTADARRLTVTAAALASLLIAALGLALGGRYGRALLIFAPWLTPAVLQDYWRAILFRESREVAGVVNDATWLAVMVLGLPFALTARTDWAVTGVWGAGALAGAILGYVQVRIPARAGKAWVWWRTDAWPLGGWVVARGLVYNASTTATMFLLTAVLGIAAVGGLRAAQTIYAPTSLLGPAIGLAGLPALSRAIKLGGRDSRKLALRLSLVALSLTAGYLTLMAIGGSSILPILYGQDFSDFSDLLIPLGAGQIAGVGAMGYVLLLKAQRRGKPLFLTVIVRSAALLVLAPLGALLLGLEGAAWALAIVSLVGTLNVVITARSWEPPL